MKPNQDRPRKFKKLYLVILIIIAAVSVLLAVSLYFVFGKGEGALPNLVRSETLYIIIALLIALPILLVILIITILLGRRKGTSSETVSDVVVKIDGVTTANHEIIPEEVQPEGSRFDGLTRIDEQLTHLHISEPTRR